MALPLERLEGKYEILAKMREGGMGAVYKVRHKLLDEVRVIKVMRPSIAGDEVVRTRFLREAQMAVKLRHPNLAQIFDFTVDDEGFAFIVMEFVDGFDLHQMMKVHGTPSVSLAVDLARQSLAVLGYLHRRGVVHRDVSPDNLLLTRDEDGGPLVKLIDLGIAKLAEDDERLTAAGSFVGKVRYSSPEHFRREEGAEIDHRSDLYSMGIVLYELLTGRCPIRGTTVPELMAGHLLQPPLPFETSDPDNRVPASLREVVLRAIAKQPTDRFGTAGELSDALDSATAASELDPAEVAVLFAAPTDATVRLTIPRPGSTQNHLDRNFQLTRTPPPEVDSTLQLADSARVAATARDLRPTTGSTVDVASQLRAFLVGAETLIEAGHIDEARVQIQAALALDPGSPEAERLLAELERRDRVESLLAEAETATREHRFEDVVGLLEGAMALDPGRSDLRMRLEAARADAAAESERRRRADELASTVRAIDRQIAEGDLEGAERGVALARKVYGANAALDPVPARLEQARAARRRSRAEELLASARGALAAQEFATALQLVDQARDLDATAAGLKDLSEAANAGLHRVAEEKRRAARAHELRARIDRLVAAERLSAARLELEGAREELGDFEGAEDLESRLARMQSEHEDHSRRVDRLLDKARGEVRGGELDAAGGTLGEVRSLTGEMPDLVEAIAEIEEWIERRREEQRRAAELREAEASIEARLAARDLDRAERELQVAERLFGRSPALATLRDRLEKARKEERNRKVESLVRSALGGQASFSDVITTLEQALAIDPSSETVQRLLAETRAAHRRYQQERRARSAASVMAEVDRLIADGHLEAALTRLDEAMAEVGPFVDALRLRPRLLRMIGSRT